MLLCLLGGGQLSTYSCGDGGAVHDEADELLVMMPVCEGYVLCGDEVATSCSCQYNSHPRWTGCAGRRNSLSR